MAVSKAGCGPERVTPPQDICSSKLCAVLRINWARFEMDDLLVMLLPMRGISSRDRVVR